MFYLLFQQMPYKLRKSPGRDRYWVIDRYGKHLSKSPLTKSRARSQMRALYAAERRKFGSGLTRRQKFLQKYKVQDRPYSLEELSEISSVPLDILQEVYNRGVGAYKTNPRSVRLKHSYVKNVDAPMSKKLSKEQWGYARVYSFLDGNPKHDEDLRWNLKGSGRQRLSFPKMLENLGLDPDKYLRVVHEFAKMYGYNPKDISLATNGIHKIEIVDPKGRIVRFGRAGYGDYIIWTFKELEGSVPEGYAEQKRHVFQTSHQAMSKKYGITDPYAPNNLALNLLW